MIDVSVDEIIQIARQAGEGILTLYQNDTIEIWQKADHSPLTEADLLSHRIIVTALNKLTADIPIISEESVNKPYACRSHWPYFWIIDPLDGTKSFLQHQHQFTVNIALIANSEPVMGVIYSPVEKKLYYASKGHGAFCQVDNSPPNRLHTHAYNSLRPLRVVVSSSHASAKVEQVIQQLSHPNTPVERLAIGSSLKFCLVAEGSADIYPRVTPTMEWDTAAGQIIACEAGKEVIVLDTEKPLTYNKKNLRNPPFIVK